MFYRLFILLNLLIIVSFVTAGQNSSAEFRLDTDIQTEGNQNQLTKTDVNKDDWIYIDIYVVGASNLDAYEFTVRWDADDINYENFYKTKGGYGIPSESNFLETHDDTSGLTEANTGGTDYRAIGLTLNGEQPDSLSADGDGFLGELVFTAKVDNPKSIQFSDIQWVDNQSNADECTNYDNEILLGGGSLPVELSSFKAVYDNGQVMITWQTESELNAWGFNIFRSKAKENGYEKINSEIIEASGTTTTPQQYSYTDERVESGQTYFYKLQQVDVDGSNEFYGPVSVSVASAVTQTQATPDVYRLYENYPNPFNPKTIIRYDLPNADDVDLKIYDISGRYVKTLIQKSLSAGQHTQVWDGTNVQNKPVPSGTYFCVLKTSQQQFVTKMTLLR